MLSNDPTISNHLQCKWNCNTCKAAKCTAFICPNMPKLFPSDQLPISKAAGAHLDTWAVDRPWLLGTCLQGGGDGWTIEPSQRAMVELFLGAPLAERSSDPINGGVLLKKKSVCSQIDAWTSHRYIVHTKIIPSFIGFISSHHILQ